MIAVNILLYVKFLVKMQEIFKSLPVNIFTNQFQNNFSQKYICLDGREGGFIAGILGNERSQE